MKHFLQIAGKLKLESSLIVALLLIAGLIVFFRDPTSYLCAILLISAVFIAVLGFVILTIRESYESLIHQKDEMIKLLSKERTREVKHSENLRAQVEKQATGGWEPVVTPVEEA